MKEEELKEYAIIWAKELCRLAGEDEAFCEDFLTRLFASKGVYHEYLHFMVTQKFSCAYKIEDVSVIDIMIWQRDHFKADLDMGHDDMKDNGDKMLLMAFDTMLKMEQDPKTYINLMKQETGSDYPGKF